MERLPNRKPNRLPCYDYSSIGAYFVTICVQDMRCILSTVVAVWGVDLDAPKNDPVAPKSNTDPEAPAVQLTAYGTIVMDNLYRMNAIYKGIHIDHYIIMPNHVHLLISITDEGPGGASRSTPPTNTLSRFIAAFKKYTNRECGIALWQRGFHDHIIRSDDDYRRHWQYIDENPKKWVMGKDAYYGFGPL